MSNFFSFLCCNTDRDVGSDEETPNQRKETQIVSLESPVIEEKYLLKEEVKYFPIFTKASMISFFESLENLKDKGKHLFKSPNLNFYVSSAGSEINPDSYLCTTIYKISKKEINSKNITLERIGQMFYDPSVRLAWDKGVNVLEDIVELKTDEENMKGKLFHVVYFSPLPGFDKRDMVDKLITFHHNGSFYTYQSSIEEDLSNKLVKIEEKTVRAKTYINATRIYETEDEIVLISFYQTDPKTIIPEGVIHIASAMTVKKFYNTFFEYLKKL